MQLSQASPNPSSSKSDWSGLGTSGQLSDIWSVKAMCLGAKGIYIGRAFLYGLGALGKQGVTKALEIIKTEADMTMALCGKRDVKELNRENVYSLK